MAAEVDETEATRKKEHHHHSQFIQNCEEMKLKKEYENEDVLKVIKLWEDFKTFAGTLDRLEELDKRLEALLVCTSYLIFQVQYSKTAPEEYRKNLQSSITSCKEVLANHHQKRVCTGICDIILNPWGDPTLNKFMGAKPKTDENSEALWEREGWVLIETRIEFLVRVGSKCIGRVCCLLHLLIEKGHRIVEENRLENPDGFHPYVFNYQKYIEYLGIYAMLCQDKKVDSGHIQIWDTWKEKAILDVISFFKEKSENPESPRLFPRLRQWKNVTTVLQWFAKGATWRGLKSSNSILLEKFFTQWMQISKCGSNGMEDTSTDSPLDEIVNDSDSISNTDNIYRIAKETIQTLGQTEFTRSNFVTLFIQAFTKDMSTIEHLKHSRVDEADKIAEMNRKLSIRYLDLAKFFKHYPKTAKKCVLTAFSLNPCIKLYSLLFPESEAGESSGENNPDEDISEYIELQGISSDQDSQITISENLGLPTKLEEDLENWIENPQYKGFLKLQSKDELKTLCNKLLKTNVAVIENKNLENLEVDYSKCEGFKSKYDPDEDYYEKVMRKRKPQTSKRNVVRKPVSRNILKGSSLKANALANLRMRVGGGGRKLPVSGTVKRGRSSKVRESRQLGLYDEPSHREERQLPNICLISNPWLKNSDSGYYTEFYNLCLQSNDPRFKEKQRCSGPVTKTDTELIESVKRTFAWKRIPENGNSKEQTTSNSSNNIPNNYFHDPCEEGLLKETVYHYQRACIQGDPQNPNPPNNETPPSIHHFRKRKASNDQISVVSAKKTEPTNPRKGTARNTTNSRQKNIKARPVVQLEPLTDEQINSYGKSHVLRNASSAQDPDDSSNDVVDGGSTSDNPSQHLVEASNIATDTCQRPPTPKQPVFFGAFQIMSSYTKGEKDKTENTNSQCVPVPSPSPTSLQDNQSSAIRKCPSNEQINREGLDHNATLTPAISASKMEVSTSANASDSDVEFLCSTPRPTNSVVKTYGKKRLVIKNSRFSKNGLEAYKADVPVVALPAGNDSLPPNDTKISPDCSAIKRSGESSFQTGASGAAVPSKSADTESTQNLNADNIQTISSDSNSGLTSSIAFPSPETNRTNNNMEDRLSGIGFVQCQTGTTELLDSNEVVVIDEELQNYDPRSQRPIIANLEERTKSNVSCVINKNYQSPTIEIESSTETAKETSGEESISDDVIVLGSTNINDMKGKVTLNKPHHFVSLSRGKIPRSNSTSGIINPLRSNSERTTPSSKTKVNTCTQNISEKSKLEGSTKDHPGEEKLNTFDEITQPGQFQLLPSAIPEGKRVDNEQVLSGQCVKTDSCMVSVDEENKLLESGDLYVCDDVSERSVPSVLALDVLSGRNEKDFEEAGPKISIERLEFNNINAAQEDVNIPNTFYIESADITFETERKNTESTLCNHPGETEDVNYSGQLTTHAEISNPRTTGKDHRKNDKQKVNLIANGKELGKNILSHSQDVTSKSDNLEASDSLGAVKLDQDKVKSEESRVCLDEVKEKTVVISDAEVAPESYDHKRPLTPVKLLEELINTELKKPSKTEKTFLEHENIKVAPSVVQHFETHGGPLRKLLLAVVKVKTLQSNEIPVKSQQALLNPMKRSPRLKQKKLRMVNFINKMNLQTSNSTAEESNEQNDSGSDIEFIEEIAVQPSPPEDGEFLQMPGPMYLKQTEKKRQLHANGYVHQKAAPASKKRKISKIKTAENEQPNCLASEQTVHERCITDQNLLVTPHVYENSIEGEEYLGRQNDDSIVADVIQLEDEETDTGKEDPLAVNDSVIPSIINGIGDHPIPRARTILYSDDEDSYDSGGPVFVHEMTFGQAGANEIFSSYDLDEQEQKHQAFFRISASKKVFSNRDSEPAKENLEEDSDIEILDEVQVVSQPLLVSNNSNQDCNRKRPHGPLISTCRTSRNRRKTLQ